jgi:tungstate transport system ATP-binding protein
MKGSLLQARQIRVRRGRKFVVGPCDLDLHAGETVALYGPNGAGKTSLLLALAGLLPRESGTVLLAGQQLGAQISLLDYHRHTAAVFQDPLLVRGSLWYNVTLGLRLRGLPKREWERRARPWLERLHIVHLANCPVASLSGGEARRASLARALVLNPEILFLDEPFVGLDGPTRSRLVGELADILRASSGGTLFVTHELGEASALCNRGIILDQGCVLQEGNMDNLLRCPASPRVAEITGVENVFEAVVTKTGPTGLSLDWEGQCLRAVAPPRLAGTGVTCAIRAEDVVLTWAGDGDRENGMPGRVEAIRRQGPLLMLTIGLGGTRRLLAVCPGGNDSLLNREVHLNLPPSLLWVFPG